MCINFFCGEKHYLIYLCIFLVKLYILNNNIIYIYIDNILRKNIFACDFYLCERKLYMNRK